MPETPQGASVASVLRLIQGVDPLNRILVTGAGGQIGSWLVPKLRALYGDAHVLASDVRTLGSEFIEAGPFQVLDATDAKAMGQAVMRFEADTIYHLAAILSAIGERDPRLAWHVNMTSLEAVLEVAREQKCAACNVLLRPQTYNEVKNNEQIMTCDSCSRILYYDPAHEAAPEPSARHRSPKKTEEEGAAPEASALEAGSSNS